MIHNNGHIPTNWLSLDKKTADPADRRTDEIGERPDSGKPQHMGQTTSAGPRNQPGAAKQKQIFKMFYNGSDDHGDTRDADTLSSFGHTESNDSPETLLFRGRICQGDERMGFTN